MYSIAIQFGNSIRFSCLIEFKTKRIRRVTNKHTHSILSLSHYVCVCVAHFVATVGGVTRPRVRVIFSNFSTYAATAVVLVGFLPPPHSPPHRIAISLPLPLLRCVARIFSRFIY